MEISRIREAVFLSGASGAGKTTLLYTLAGLNALNREPSSSKDARSMARRRATQARLRMKKMGFVFQGYFLLPELTALENVLLPGMIGRRATKETAAESLRAVGLTDQHCIICRQNFPAANSNASRSRER